VKLLKGDKMRLQYYSAVWCGPCKMFGPVMDRINNDFENVEIQKLDADVESDLVIKYSITNIPTVIQFDENDNEVKRIVGALPYDKVVEEFGLAAN